ncbi:unnamed protein product [Eruca vesicaria subsp. sativa]|uniref:Proline dehydrogenase n=1 Tax=Eruca vesicaria subsp. sativa TaxID=29727 RepID=A0ABC8KBQ1_ERUVS|nr:unnamed protein product [Eruca vesicaria subsp. sativa]
MSSECKLADSLGNKSLVHNTIQERPACYNICMIFFMEKASNGSGIPAILATHNTDTGKQGARKVSELGINKENKKIEHAQL